MRMSHDIGRFAGETAGIHTFCDLSSYVNKSRHVPHASCDHDNHGNLYSDWLLIHRSHIIVTQFEWCAESLLVEPAVLECHGSEEMATGEKGVATELKLWSYALPWSFSHASYWSWSRSFIPHHFFVLVREQPCFLFPLSPFLLSCGLPIQQIPQVTPAHKYLLHKICQRWRSFLRRP